MLRKLKFSLRDIIRSVVERQLTRQCQRAQQAITVSGAIMKMGFHAKVIDAIEHVVPGAQQILVRQTIEIGAIHIRIQPVDVDVWFRGWLRVIAAAMMVGVVSLSSCPVLLASEMSGLQHKVLGSRHWERGVWGRRSPQLKSVSSLPAQNADERSALGRRSARAVA